MTKNNELQKELQAKLKEGIKPSDLKIKKNMPLFSKKDKEKELLKTIEHLETEKAEHLTLIANYEKEQSLSVTTFQEQEKVINQKEQQLSGKDEEISTLNEKTTQLKARIDQIFKEKKDLRKLLKDNNIAILESLETAELGIQTEPLANKELELEDQLLEKRSENLKDFIDYRNKLANKDQIISDLQEKIKNLLAQPDNNKKRALILGIIALINSLLLIFK